LTAVRVSSPSYIQVGFIDLHGGLGRLYGSIGFTLEEPRYVVEASPARGAIEAEAPDWAEWIIDYARESCKHYRCGGVRLRIASAPPPWVGVGSRPALALAVDMAVALTARRRFNPEDAVLRAGGGPEAGLAVHSFTHGGFIVDGGVDAESPDREVPPLIFRAVVPPTWRLIVAAPRAEAPPAAPTPGLAGEEEAAVNARLALMAVMPGAITASWSKVAPLLQAINHATLKVLKQGGEPYCCPQARQVAEELARAGAPCTCQPPLGAAVFTITKEEDSTRILARALEALKRLGGVAWSTRVDNRGAYAEPIT
jgi:beta-ribofuranosylaminobenzene 5'-phosphate synthase